jgi:hypothetical protein
MTAPDHFAETQLNILRRRGRPHMIFANASAKVLGVGGNLEGSLVLACSANPLPCSVELIPCSLA